jgi:signal transduction histidine kinase
MEENCTVLIVDDSPSDRARFRTCLAQGGYTIFEVGLGSETVKKALEVRPHIIVLDLNLPDMDGLAVCRALRRNRQVAEIPVLMLTVRHDDTDVLAGLEAGVDDYIAKDSAPELIRARVRRLIHYRQLVSLTMLNRQLVQVGRLLAGIIHEIRGPLSVIRGSAELLRLTADPEHIDVQCVDSILRNTQLLQVRIDHLMATVRSGPPQIQTLHLGPLVLEAVELFVKGLPPNGREIRVEACCGSDTPIVQADAGRIMQVLIDLLTNAYQAISAVRSFGQIEISLDEVDQEDRAWARILVSDDGPGIPEIHLSRLFEPFFTTKETGSGYGLYLACEILKEQRGRLTAGNVAGKGACFTVWLPRAQVASGSTP